MQRIKLALFVCSAAVAACGAAAKSGNDGPAESGGGTGGETTSAGTGGAPASGGSAPTASGGSLSLDAGASDAPEITPDAACAAQKFQGEPAPLNLMVMLDRSGSMSLPTDDSLWSRTKNGLTKFLKDPAADGIGVALHYFPTPDSDEVTYCQGDEATPTVAMGKLSAEPAPADVQEQKLIDSMDAQTFNNGGTPMYQALYGALSFASVYAQDHSDEQIVVILVTDGVPGESCDYMQNNNIPKIAGLAKWAHDASPSITTFTIGLTGSQEADMQSIAQSGGGQAFFLGGSNDVTSDLFAKLDAIKQSNLGCSFKLPSAAPGKAADPKKVNVKLDTPSGATPFYKVKDAADCVPNGWYYDDEKHPSKIELCPDACKSVKSSVDGELSVLVGCATEVPK